MFLAIWRHRKCDWRVQHKPLWGKLRLQPSPAPLLAASTTPWVLPCPEVILSTLTSGETVLQTQERSREEKRCWREGGTEDCNCRSLSWDSRGRKNPKARGRPQVHNGSLVTGLYLLPIALDSCSFSQNSGRQEGHRPKPKLQAPSLCYEDQRPFSFRSSRVGRVASSGTGSICTQFSQHRACPP